MSHYVVHWFHPVHGWRVSQPQRTLLEATALEKAIKRRIGLDTRIEEVR